MRVALMTAVVLTMDLLASPPAYACSKGTFPTSPDASQAFFTGRAAADTLLAGPGAVVYGSGGGHYGRTDRRAIYGQLVRVEQLGGPAAGLLPRGTREVVVVPWDYDAACRPLAWGRSARWVTPGAHGFYIADLRAPEHWVAGKPTFDVHNPGHLPYDGTRHILEMENTGLSSLLSPDQVFDLYRALPTADELAKKKSEALGRLRQWVRAHPDLARRPPAEWLLSMVLGAVAHAELKEVDHPVLGTWRFGLRMPGDASYTFHARTEQHPTDRWTPSRARVASVPGELRLAPADGYTFLVVFSDDLEGLPEHVLDRQAYIYALALPDSSGTEKTEWRGWIEPSLLQRAFPDDPVVRKAAEEARERFSGRYREGLPDEMPARFTRGADGVLRVRQPFPLRDGRVLLVEGEQLSRQVTRP